MISSALGYLVDAQDNVLEENCTPDNALEYLKRRNWDGGRTVWLAYDTEESYQWEDADLDFVEVAPQRTGGAA
jgi:hypothetical protein